MEGQIKKIDMHTYELMTGKTSMRLVRDQEMNWSLGCKLETVGEWRKAKTNRRFFESLVELEREHNEWQGIAELVEPQFYSSAIH